MNCSDISELAPLHLTGELDPARAEAFAAHLGECASCRQELVQQAALDQRLRAGVLVEDIDSSRVDQRVRVRIEAGRRTARRRVYAGAGIAAVLVLGVVGYRTITSSGTRLLDAAAAKDHRVEVVDLQARKWSADRISIERMAERQGLPVSVVSFVPAGYHLAKGRLCFLDGRIFLHLVYANDGGNFSLFLRRPDHSATTDVHASTFTMEHVAGFQHGQVMAVIVGEQAGDEVLRLAKSAAAVL